jgi:spermidine synthase
VTAQARTNAPLYIAVGLVAGAVIALQICIMRIFAIGSWAHFGSFVVSLAMLGFGLTSAVMCVAKTWFERHALGVITASLLLFGPLAVASNLLAQQVPFNAIFLVSDPAQKWRLLANFLLYLLPFLAGATFLGTVFLQQAKTFNRVYFADLAGAGFGGLIFLLAMYVLAPQDLIVAPLILWLLGSLAFFFAYAKKQVTVVLGVVAALTLAAHFAVPPWFNIAKLAVSDYKGVAYARKFPDSQRVYERDTPFGYLEVYGSSYLHFAPGLSDNAAFNLKDMPANAYLGLYIDGEGPSGIIRNLPKDQTDYYRFLPMIYPYVVKDQPRTFVVQFGGGLSTSVALDRSSHVTVAEGNPAVLAAFRNDATLKALTGDILANPRLDVVDYDGRLFLAHTPRRFDVIDLSLADSAGLSSPGGFSVVEKFSYARESMQNYMRALAPGGILSVTLWNKEEPPKSVIKLYATMAQAAEQNGEPDIAQSFFVVSSYLATATVLYKKGGFTEEEVAKLRAHTRAMSFDEIYYPGFVFDPAQTQSVLDGYKNQVFSEADAAPGTLDLQAGGEPEIEAPAPESSVLPSTLMGRLTWHYLIHGGWPEIASQYVFDARSLTNDRPYFAAYIKPLDLPKILDRLELVQDEWGYLLLWATLLVAIALASTLVLIPVIFGWRTIFSRYPGKLRTILYFACLGAGYIMVEVGLIAEFVLALSNATVSASVMITGMLIFSGLGSLASERYLDRSKIFMPRIFIGIGAFLIAYGLWLHFPLDWIGQYPYGLRLLLCFGLIAPPAFLMGFPMPTAMDTLARLGKDHMFLWAWGINGCFSVIGAAAVPLVATAFGLSSVLFVAAGAYLLALPAFYAVLLPVGEKRVAALAA